MSVPVSTRQREDVFVIDECLVVASSGKALLVEADVILELTGGKRRGFWCPLSCIDDDSELFDESVSGDEGDLVITMWLAEQEGLT